MSSGDFVQIVANGEQATLPGPPMTLPVTVGRWAAVIPGGVPLSTIFNSHQQFPMLPVPLPSLTETLSYQLFRHALPRLGIDIEQSTPVPVLAPWAEFYPHPVSCKLTEPLCRLFKAGLIPFRRIHTI